MIAGFLTLPAPRLPVHATRAARTTSLAVSAMGHAIVMGVLLAITAGGSSAPPIAVPALTAHEAVRLPAPRMVFLPTHALGRGGGGGGNRQPAPIRRAERVGRDRMTVPVGRPLTTAGRLVDVPAPAQQILLAARPSASGLIEQIGAVSSGVDYGSSQGPGSGGGVGDGTGTGLGSGKGPGLGPGAGGGTGGGFYRPGGPVTAPTIRSEVRPSYTSEALRTTIQGSVILELVVRRDGQPTDIRIVQSLDPSGLDKEAIKAVRQWRFNPGRIADTPVDVLVTVVMDFWIR